jgi:hypothetical protein
MVGRAFTKGKQPQINNKLTFYCGFDGEMGRLFDFGLRLPAGRQGIRSFRKLKGLKKSLDKLFLFSYHFC